MSPRRAPSEPVRAHLLVVDDDDRTRDLLKEYLTRRGFGVSTAADAASARKLLASLRFDLLVVDVMMPGETGVEFTRKLREISRTPVLLLTALGESQDRIAGLESGADDYLPKPFEPRELVLRLRSILRRSVAKRDVAKGFKIGRWSFDPEHEELRDGDEAQKLTSAEVNLIKALASRPSEVVTREELARRCGLDAGDRAIDVQVTRLRRKIEETKNPRLLMTVRGKGYMLRVEDL